MQCMSLRVHFVSEVDRLLRTVGDLDHEFMLLKYNEFRSHFISDHYLLLLPATCC